MSCNNCPWCRVSLGIPLRTWTESRPSIESSFLAFPESASEYHLDLTSWTRDEPGFLFWRKERALELGLEFPSEYHLESFRVKRVERPSPFDRFRVNKKKRKKTTRDPRESAIPKGVLKTALKPILRAPPPVGGTAQSRLYLECTLETVPMMQKVGLSVEMLDILHNFSPHEGNPEEPISWFEAEPGPDTQKQTKNKEQTIEAPKEKRAGFECKTKGTLSNGWRPEDSKSIF